MVSKFESVFFYNSIYSDNLSDVVFKICESSPYSLHSLATVQPGSVSLARMCLVSMRF